MKRLKALLCGAFVLVLTSVTTTVLKADSADFAGPYIGLRTSITGLELDGSHTAANDDTADVSVGTIGKFAVVPGIEAGYLIPIGNWFLIDIGASTMWGEGEMSTSSDDSDKKVTFQVSNLASLYIAPTFTFGHKSSVYIKAGTSRANTQTTGDVTDPETLNGFTLAVGSKTLLTKGLFLRTEAGFTDYEPIGVKGKGGSGTDGIATGTSVNVDPTIAYGSISIGYQF